MPDGDRYWVEFNDHVFGVPTEEGERTFEPGDQVELELYSLKSLRFAWFTLIPPPEMPKKIRKKKNKREVDQVNRTPYRNG